MRTSIFKKCCFATKTALFVAGMVIIQCMANNALATPVLYQYSTATNPFGATGGAIDFFNSGAFVTGTFMYDAATPTSGTGSSGATNYGGSITALTGTVQGFSFFDSRGRTQVGDELIPGPVDDLNIMGQPTLYDPSLTGFYIGGYSLVNIRLFWREGILGIPDFLNDENLPAVLPSFQGRLALDFVPIGTSPTTPNFNHSVFFDGLTVTPVPEPEIYAMMGLGLGLLGWVGRRRKLAA